MSLDTGGIYCPGEYMSWSLTWRGLQGATTQLVVGERGVIDGQEAIIVKSSSQTSELANVFHRVREELRSDISLVDGLPLQNSGDAKEDDERELTEVEFLPGNSSYQAKLSTNVGDGKEWLHKGEHKIHDLHSFLSVLRSWDAAPGSKGIAFVQNGRSLYRVELAIGNSTSLNATIGKTAAFVLKGRAYRVFMDGELLEKGREHSFTVWRSDDNRYLPLRFEVGTRLGVVRGELVDYRQPATSACIATSAKQ